MIPVDDPAPVVVAVPSSERQNQTPVMIHGRDATLVPPSRPPIKGPYTYTQVTRPVAEDEILPLLDMDSEYKRVLLAVPVPGVRGFTRDILADWIDKGRLAPSDLEMALDPADLERPQDRPLGIRVLAPRRRAKIALLLSMYLRSEGGYTYSLEFKRVDRTLDPSEDFLRNVKQGSCEHYASALTLMLRSVAIPCRLVSGFHGQEAVGDGVYQVRENHSHTWVEALLRAPGCPRTMAGILGLSRSDAGRSGSRCSGRVHLDQLVGEQLRLRLGLVEEWHRQFQPRCTPERHGIPGPTTSRWSATDVGPGRPEGRQAWPGIGRPRQDFDMANRDCIAHCRLALFVAG